MAKATGKLSTMKDQLKRIEDLGDKICDNIEGVWNEFLWAGDYWKGLDHSQFIKNGANKNQPKLEAAIKYVAWTLPKTIDNVRQSYQKSMGSKPSSAMTNQNYVPTVPKMKEVNEDDTFDFDSGKMKNLVTKTGKNMTTAKRNLDDILKCVQKLGWDGDAAASVLPLVKDNIKKAKTAMDSVYKNLEKNVNEAIARREQFEKDAAGQAKSEDI